MATFRSMPNAIMTTDMARPMQDMIDIALNDWSAAIAEMVFMVPPLLFVQTDVAGSTLKPEIFTSDCGTSLTDRECARVISGRAVA